MTYRDRRTARVERLREWAEKRARKSTASFAAVHQLADAIPLGQPILVGHHSERHARRDAERIHHGMARGIEHQQKADAMTSRAANIEAAADRAIYNDDPDAVERLTEKLATLETQRERIRAINRGIRKGCTLANLVPPMLIPELTPAERRELQSLAHLCPWAHVETRGFPPYTLTNLGGNIIRIRQRVAVLKGSPRQETRVIPDAPVPATATARAGLVVHATMTTPSRAGKHPRPVWNVSGNYEDGRRELLVRLGGSWYHNRFSFWEDPTDHLEAACLAAEQERTP